ncbi:hypothetical protein [Streptosporangium sandarakinum]|uniref:hypothetical protein n=1 Tax=Streptosporangium sandarakinum TaxID=1260955 RepID=UPI003711E17C
MSIRHVAPVPRRSATGRVAEVYAQSTAGFGQAAFMMSSPAPELHAAAGAVLPGGLDWSPRHSYDLSDPAALRVMYEQIIQKGQEQDLKAHLNADPLIRIRSEPILPVRVRQLQKSRFAWLRDRAA